LSAGGTPARREHFVRSNQRNIPAELDCIAKALFFVQKDSFAGDRLCSTPDWPWQGASLATQLFCLPPPLIVSPPSFKPANGWRISIEGIYLFNEARTPPQILSLSLEDARELGRRLVEAVYAAKTQLVITSGVRITINVIANGYYLQIGDMNNATELFLSTGCIWRVCQGLLRIVDLLSPAESH
jgi:hypothetical protein